MHSAALSIASRTAFDTMPARSIRDRAAHVETLVDRTIHQLDNPWRDVG
jgi:hypothetical protein